MNIRTLLGPNVNQTFLKGASYAQGFKDYFQRNGYPDPTCLNDPEYVRGYGAGYEANQDYLEQRRLEEGEQRGPIEVFKAWRDA